MSVTPHDAASAAARDPRRGARALPWLVRVAVFASILTVMLARLPEPLFGDQALNMLMGRVIAEGGRPYADVWDLKHPGIFFFFAAAGALFGFNEIGIHLFELLWMLALGILITIVADSYVGSRSIASLTPVFTIGTYYALTTGYHLTQTEALIGLPMLVSLVATVRAVQSDSSHRGLWLVVSGTGAGVVAVFKAPYVVIPILFWLSALLFSASRAGGAQALARAMAPTLLAGLLIPVLPTMAYLATKSGWTLLWWTFVQHPGEAASQGGVFLGRFVDSLVWFVRTFRVPLLLAVVALWANRHRQGDLLTLGLVTWIAAGVVVVWAQVISWWPYHYLSLLVPVGLLAARGLEVLWTHATGSGTPVRWRALAAVLLCACAVLYWRQVRPVPELIVTVLRGQALPLDTAAMRELNAARFEDYDRDFATTAFLRNPGSHVGPIFVLGNPNLYHFADRRPAIPLVVWGTSPPAGAWPHLIENLRTAAPPYVFVGHEAASVVVDFDGSVVAHLRALERMLAEQYRRYRVDGAGTWYIRADLTAIP